MESNEYCVHCGIRTLHVNGRCMKCKGTFSDGTLQKKAKIKKKQQSNK